MTAAVLVHRLDRTSRYDVVEIDERTHSTEGMATARDSTVGVAVNGVGDDGVGGMAADGRTDGLGIALAEDDCAVSGMPRRAIERGPADTITDVQDTPHAMSGDVDQ